MAGIIARILMRGMRKNSKKEVQEEAPDYEKARKEQDRLNSLSPLPRDVRKKKDPLGFWFESGQGTKGKIVLYIHGGGFTTGSAEHAGFLPGAIARRGGYPVLSLDYGLAPEHPFPEGLTDCMRAWQDLMERGYRGRDIVLMGDSAGGNLCFALAFMLRDRGMELPSGIIGISPVGTLDDRPPSRKERADRDPVFDESFVMEMKAAYAAGRNAEDPLLSPAYGDFRGLPPVWLCAGTDEIFYDDAFMIRDAAERAGIRAELITGNGLPHVYPLLPDPESSRAIAGMRRFAKECLG